MSVASLSSSPAPKPAAAAADRRVVFRSQVLKPFVFLDLFDNRGDAFPTFGLHPHSGLATLTYVAEGSVSYEDTNGATGVLRAGGVEWMRAGKGVWHAGGAGDPGLTRGFQLWIALPPTSRV
jgi:redox-sensitive bicupin YhaK (pirin superfamily)